jgi:thioredoxin-like negative regulator of GroEL
MAQWIEIYEEEQFEELAQEGPVIALFGSSSNMAWNSVRMPIQGLTSSPVIPPFVKILYVDKDRLPQIAQKRNVKTVPTARFLNDGRQMSELTGEQVTAENIHRNFDKMMQAAH